MSFIREVRDLLQRPLLRVVALSCMLAGIAAMSLDVRLAVRDNDNWWHLRVGDWILQNHAVPHLGLFSGPAADRPWMAYSWFYEILLSISYRFFGLVGLGVFGIGMTLLVAGVFFWMLYRISGKFWTSWILTFIGCFGFLFKLLPRPVFFSIALFIVTVGMILESHRYGRIQRLYWLPLVILLWANLHIQFIYGLFTIGLYCFVSLFVYLAGERGWMPDSVVRSPLPLKKLFMVLGACILASCIGPYTFHLYEVILNYSRSRAAYASINELQAPKFEYLTDYVLLLLTVAAYFVLGWTKKVDLFKILLFVTATVFAFRATRDVWFMGVCAAAIIADFAARADGLRGKLKVWEYAATGAIVAFLFALVAMNSGLTARQLDRVISAEYPVDAVNYIRRNPAPGPLYNDFGWGGFLIWYMPEYPVSIDGRTDLYGEEMTTQALQSQDGAYGTDKLLDEAGVVLLNRNLTLALKLASDPRFRIVYEDKIATVFVRIRD